jgi:hypothetical protein
LHCIFLQKPCFPAGTLQTVDNAAALALGGEPTTDMPVSRLSGAGFVGIFTHSLSSRKHGCACR